MAGKKSERASDERVYETLEVERDGPVLRVWLNRPERLNAIDNTMLRELGDLFHSLETDWETRVVVLGGRGRSFCAGADRKGSVDPQPPTSPSDRAPTSPSDRAPTSPSDRAPTSPSDRAPTSPSDRAHRWLSQLGRRACRAIEDCEVVTVARVHGHAVGGGACFALACDFRVAARDALFRVPEVDLGVPLTWGATPRLLSEIGAARTREVLMLCEEIEAERAASWGMVHRVVGPDELDAEVDRLAAVLAGKPEMAVHMTKTQLRSYARLAASGDVTETDGDMLDIALRSESARGLFRMPRKP